MHNSTQLVNEYLANGGTIFICKPQRRYYKDTAFPRLAWAHGCKIATYKKNR